MTCPVCDAPAQRGQLVCLECGSRITLGYRRPPSWKVPVALTALVLVLTGAGGALAYQAIGNDAEREVARAPANPKEDPSGGAEKGEGNSSTEAEPSTTQTDGQPKDDSSKNTSEGEGDAKLGTDDPAIRDRGAGDEQAADDGGLTKSGGLYKWPRDLRAFTVVLLSAEDRPSALRFARAAGESGQDRIGVLRSRDFKSLPRGFFVVFVDNYPSRAGADQAATRLARRFPGAFSQLVRK